MLSRSPVPLPHAAFAPCAARHARCSSRPIPATAAVAAVAAARVVGRVTPAEGREMPCARCPVGVLVAPEPPAATAAHERASADIGYSITHSLRARTLPVPVPSALWAVQNLTTRTPSHTRNRERRGKHAHSPEPIARRIAHQPISPQPRGRAHTSPRGRNEHDAAQPKPIPAISPVTMARYVAASSVKLS